MTTAISRSHGLLRPLLLAAALAAPTVGSCTPCGDTDGPGVDNMLASAERWVHVLSWPSVGASEHTDTVQLDVAPVAPDGTDGRPRVEAISLHGSFVPGIGDAMSRGDAVYLAMASEGLDREVVFYVLGVTAERDHRLIGE